MQKVFPVLATAELKLATRRCRLEKMGSAPPWEQSPLRGN